MAPTCERCGSTEIQLSYCQTCQTAISPFQAATYFDDPVRPAIHAIKYSGTAAIGNPLGDLLAHAWPTWRTRAEIVTPVPLHPERQRERGYNQSELIAKRFAKQVDLPMRCDILFRVRHTRPQVGLQGKGRRDNVRGAFMAVEPLVRKKHILLVDDVLTTGATITESAETLYRAGAQSVTAFCLARAQTYPLIS
jgi:ComF family protein